MPRRFFIDSHKGVTFPAILAMMANSDQWQNSPASIYPALYWLPFIILCRAVAVECLPNMRRKDKSLARYPECENYKRNSRKFIPFLY